jgi:putative phosphoesterase
MPLSTGLHPRAVLPVLILSDTHGQVDPRVLALASASQAVVHGGDIGSSAVLFALRETGVPLIAVRGNNDLPERWPDGTAGLQALPDTAELPLPGGILTVTHGHQHNPVGARHRLLRERFPDARAIVYGHSHRLVCDLDRPPWVLNPGAAGRTRTYGGPSCILLHVQGADWRVEPLRFTKL